MCGWQIGERRGREQSIPKSIITPSNWPLKKIYTNNKKGTLCSWLLKHQQLWSWFNGQRSLGACQSCSWAIIYLGCPRLTRDVALCPCCGVSLCDRKLQAGAGTSWAELAVWHLELCLLHAYYSMDQKGVGRGKSKKMQPEKEPGCLPKVLTLEFSFSIYKSGCNQGSFLNL